MSDSVEVRAPAEQTEGTRSQILRWLKQVGEAVTENEPLIEIETDKVTVEVAAPGTGVLREILKQEQDEIVPGDLLGRIQADEGTAVPAAAATLSAAGPVAAPAAAARPHGGGLLSPAVRRLLAEHGLEAADVTGSGSSGRITVEDVLQAAARPRAAVS